MKESILSIIVPSRDGKIDFLKAQLSQQTFKNWELIVSVGYPSPPLSRNQGAKRAKCPYLLFLDDDIHLSSKQFLSKIMKHLLTISSLSVLGVEWRVPPDATKFQKNIYGNSFNQKRDTKETLRVVPWLDTVAGSCMAMRRDTFDKLGGFEERLISGEDPDFFYRVWLQGGKTYMVSDIWIYHYPPATIKSLFKKTLWYSRGNSQVAKKYPESNYRPVLRNMLHASGLLILHTLALVPLVFFKFSFHYRKPSFSFRPLSALVAYFGFWVYCISWFMLPAIPRDPLPPITREEESAAIEEVEVLS
jgi:GT2 family glycosyltransferase